MTSRKRSSIRSSTNHTQICTTSSAKAHCQPPNEGNPCQWKNNRAQENNNACSRRIISLRSTGVFLIQSYRAFACLTTGVPRQSGPSLSRSQSAWSQPYPLTSPEPRPPSLGLQLIPAPCGPRCPASPSHPYCPSGTAVHSLDLARSVRPCSCTTIRISRRCCYSTPDRADRLPAKCLLHKECRTPPRGTALPLCFSPPLRASANR